MIKLRYGDGDGEGAIVGRLFFFSTHKRVYCRLRKPGDSDLLGGRAHQTANWASFL